MKLRGPDAVPPPESFSVDPRRTERFVPVPDPHLNSIPSVLARSRIEDIESCTELIKQAEHWGLVYPRRTERFVPVPDPHLKSIPSLLARSRIEDIESCTELIKQAEHWGLLY